MSLLRVGEIVLDGRNITCDHASSSQNDNLSTNINVETNRIVENEVAKAKFEFAVSQAKVQLAEALSNGKVNEKSEQVAVVVENQAEDALASARLEDARLELPRLDDQEQAESDDSVRNVYSLQHFHQVNPLANALVSGLIVITKPFL